MRVHGPYKFRNRWRVLVDDDDNERTMTTYASEAEAEVAKKRISAEVVAQEAALDAPLMFEVLLASKIKLPSRPHWIYFLHDESDVIVYVGVTAKIGTRLSSHRKNKMKFAAVSYIPIALPRKQAFRLERMLIRRLDPAWNIKLRVRKEFSPELPQSEIGDDDDNFVNGTARDD